MTDFQFLNSRLVRTNLSIPLVRDTIQMLGASKCKVLSVIDLKDAYHTLHLDEQSQKYCRITPYFGSPMYVYQRLGMGLSVSPAIWQNFITAVLGELPHKEHHIAIMDDCFIHSKRGERRFLEIVNFAWHIEKLFHHKKGNDEKFQTTINKLNEAVKQNTDNIVIEHGQLMALTR